MNKVFRFILPAIAVLIFAGASAHECQAQGQIREILNRMDANNKAMKSLISSIQMAKLDSVLGETEMKKGNLTYLPGRSEKEMYLRINWKEPLEEHLAVAKGQYVLYTPRRKQAIVGKVDGVKGKGSKAGGVLAFMSMSKAQLKENYEVKLMGEETVKDGTKTWHLVLIPLKPTSYKSADLWVDANGMPVQARIVEKNNDTNTILLTNIQRNSNVEASVFKITPPKGTAIVQG